MQGNAFSTVPWQLYKDPQEASESWKEDLRFTQKGMNRGADDVLLQASSTPLSVSSRRLSGYRVSLLLIKYESFGFGFFRLRHSPSAYLAAVQMGCPVKRYP